jgi:hypothetical protein
VANLTPGSAVEVLVDGFWLRGEIWDASVTAQGVWFHVWCRADGGERYLATVRSSGVRERKPGGGPSGGPSLTGEPSFRS